MSVFRAIQHAYEGNSCKLTIKIKRQKDESAGRCVQNVRNCDVFLEDNYFVMYLDVQLYKFYSGRRFDLKDLKNVCLQYNTKDGVLQVSLPCLPLNLEEDTDKEKDFSQEVVSEIERPLDLWKLKRITDHCLIKIDDTATLMRPEAAYDYGFASKFRGRINCFECDMNTITRMPEPNLFSPLQRAIDREIDEMKNFSRDQYKLNFVELQVPDGHDNPMQYTINFKDCILDREQECLLHNLTCKSELMEMPDEYNVMEIDCGLIGILLGICYDVRFTSNEPNCESAWTRSILSATLTYFEPFTSLKDVVISFMRRSLIYPLYRNYELSRLCVEDCITSLQGNTQWILKQLLVTHDMFNDNERSVFNHYYIDDYIRYLTNVPVCPSSHLHMLAYNLKNVLYDILKKHLCLGLQELETELLKDIITDIHVAASTSEEESDISTSTDDSSSSDDDEGSVIEQKMDNLKLK